MATQLSVVNDCLAIMGEAPLNAIAEDHAFKSAAVGTLARLSTTVQSRGWWFNMETLTLSASPVDFRIYVPTDTGTVLAKHANVNIVQRGRVMYDLDKGTDRFAASFTMDVRLTRILALEDIPASVADLIAAKVVLEFQSLYDGDQTKTRNLAAMVGDLQTLAMAEHVRNRRVNLIDISERLYRIRRVIHKRY